MSKIQTITKDQVKNGFIQQSNNLDKSKCIELSYNVFRHGYIVKLWGGNGVVFKQHTENYQSYIDAVDRLTYLSGKHKLELQPVSQHSESNGVLSVPEIRDKMAQLSIVSDKIDRLRVEIETYEKMKNAYSKELEPYRSCLQD